MADAGLGIWRVPICIGLDSNKTIDYKPVFGCQFGVVGGLPVARLLKVFTWHVLKGYLETKARLPTLGEYPMFNGEWPERGFDEWFLAVAAYPRLAESGVLSFVPTDARSLLLALDIEYVTWANPASEMVFVRGHGGEDECAF
ncbi:hypothetical protein Hsar01_01166 [Haloferula sargassicola]|uniref:Uncharacterized protein n=2 Tax=Haloferula sargassicola TaxID=490096 RepID=A0ABP9UNM8_9BACT